MAACDHRPDLQKNTFEHRIRIRYLICETHTDKMFYPLLRVYITNYHADTISQIIRH